MRRPTLVCNRPNTTLSLISPGISLCGQISAASSRHSTKPTAEASNFLFLDKADRAPTPSCARRACFELSRVFHRCPCAFASPPNMMMAYTVHRTSSPRPCSRPTPRLIRRSPGHWRWGQLPLCLRSTLHLSNCGKYGGVRPCQHARASDEFVSSNFRE